MGLLLHELATNAIKYGSLSAQKGEVLIRWSLVGRRLQMLWRESGGPDVTEPTRHGFGTRLVSGVLASYGGKIETQFERRGLVCNVTIDLPEFEGSLSNSGDSSSGGEQAPGASRSRESQ
jgi:two-component system CheB/CheR fusion protein